MSERNDRKGSNQLDNEILWVFTNDDYALVKPLFLWWEVREDKRLRRSKKRGKTNGVMGFWSLAKRNGKIISSPLYSSLNNCYN